VTVSHLRFGPRPIRSSYKIQRAGFVACHQPQLLERFEIAELAEDGATLLLNAPWAGGASVFASAEGSAAAADCAQDALFLSSMRSESPRRQGSVG
jgi:Pyruvate/2-oxoacid:ferredoxin oxidoreductase gamma subunit